MKIRGNTVGTPISPTRVEKDLKPVKTVNGVAPDENGNVEVTGNNVADGKDGRGIKSIVRTSGTGAAGTTDTYTITYTDDTTSTFTVYNGKNGTNGKDGTTPHIGANGNWFIGDTDTGVAAGGVGGGEYEIPTFNLAALGLPSIAPDGEYVMAEFDTTELMGALDKGAVKFVAQFNMGAEVSATLVLNPAYAPVLGGYSCTSLNDFEGILLITTVSVSEGFIAAKCTPMDDAIGGGSGGVSSWNDLTDKPFGEVVETIEPITWDGNAEGLLEVTPEGFDYGVRFYKVSDRIFSFEQLKSMIYSTFSDEIDYEDEEYTYHIGDELEDLISSGCITEDIFDLYGEVCIVRKPGATGAEYDCTFPETGVYFYRNISPNGRVAYANSLYIEGNSFSTLKQLDNKYLEPFEGITEEELLPTRVGQSSMSDLGIYAIPSDTTEEMFNRWQGNGDNPITGNVFVEFDGVTYECAPQRLAAMDNAMAVGNCAAFGGTGNGEPFVISMIVGTNTDGDGNVTNIYSWAIGVLTDTAPTEHQYRVYQPYDKPKYMLKESHLPFDAIAAYIDNYIDEALGGDY